MESHLSLSHYPCLFPTKAHTRKQQTQNHNTASKQNSYITPLSFLVISLVQTPKNMNQFGPTKFCSFLFGLEENPPPSNPPRISLPHLEKTHKGLDPTAPKIRGKKKKKKKRQRKTGEERETGVVVFFHNKATIFLIFQMPLFLGCAHFLHLLL